MKLVEGTYKLTNMLPNNETFGLISQMNRAGISIPSNIAEASSRDSDKNYKRFLEIALGSAFELETQTLIVQRLHLAPNSVTAQIL